VNVVEYWDLVELVVSQGNAVEQCAGFIDTGIEGSGRLWRVIAH